VKERLIHIPPGGLDPQILYWLEEDMPDIFEEDLQRIGQWQETEAWDDNKQHTENWS
jgi:hypothetical protein